MWLWMIACAAPSGAPETRMVGYQPTWTGLDAGATRFEDLTHVCLAFANPPVDGGPGVVFPDVSDDEVTAYVEAAHAAGVQVLASIGGGSDSPRLPPYYAPDRVDAFVDDIVALVDRHDLDGVDVDIEGEAITGDYGALVVALRDALGDRLLTAAVATWNGAAIPDEALLAYDFLGVMSYDQCGPWSEACEHSTYDAAVDELAYWVDERGFPAADTVLGVPFYGYCWGAACRAEYVSYADIVDTWPDWADRDWVEEADLALSFNGPTTIGRKAELARGYGGAMIWELTLDAPGEASLLSVLTR